VTVCEPVSRVSTLERRHLGGTFLELCRIESPSGRERACAEHVIAELRALGVDVEEDRAGEPTGSDCGNLLARMPGRAPVAAAGEAPGSRSPLTAASAQGAARRSLLLCAHLDTVPLAAPVEPVLVEGGWENANDGILGADNKAAVAVLLALARRIAREGSPLDVEFLFTVGEETSLAGAREFDVSKLRSDFGYVFDHASPIGEVIVSSPTQFRLRIELRGAAAHAGIHPEDGRSAILAAARAIAAIPLGRVDPQTTVNVGTISGGTALNVVPEHCRLDAEVRSFDDRLAETLVAEIVDRVHEAANLPDCDCDADVSVERTFTGYTQPPSGVAIEAAELALRACGHEPRRVSSGGGSDANALIAKGFPVVNLANGTERAHEPGERVSTVALEGMLDVALALLDQAVALSPGSAV
jgi:tripeptide aminopeptidase